MSISLACVQVAPSYGDFHVPEVEAQASLVTTLVPSLFKTNSLCNVSALFLLSRGLCLPGVASALIGLPVREKISVVSVGVGRGGNSKTAQEGSSTRGAGNTRLRCVRKLTIPQGRWVDLQV